MVGPGARGDGGALSRFVFVAIIASLSWARAAAQPEPSPGLSTVEIEGCPTGFSEALQAQLAVELVDVDALVRELLDSSTLRVSVTCDAEGATTLRIEHESGLILTQAVEEEGAGRSRRASIVLVQLVAAAADVLARQRHEPSEPPEPQEHVAAERRSTDRPLFLRARARLAFAHQPLTAAPGGALGFELGVLPWLVVQLDVGVLGARRKIEAGTIMSRSASLSLALLVGAELGWVTAHLGPSVRVGLVALTGVPRDPMRVLGRTAIEPWASVGVTARLGARVGARVRLDVDFEAGGVALGPTALAMGDPALAWRGAWLEARAGIAIALR